MRWLLQGSNGGSAWVTLDDRTAEDDASVPETPSRWTVKLPLRAQRGAVLPTGQELPPLSPHWRPSLDDQNLPPIPMQHALQLLGTMLAPEVAGNAYVSLAGSQHDASSLSSSFFLYYELLTGARTLGLADEAPHRYWRLVRPQDAAAATSIFAVDAAASASQPGEVQILVEGKGHPMTAGASGTLRTSKGKWELLKRWTTAGVGMQAVVHDFGTLDLTVNVTKVRLQLTEAAAGDAGGGGGGGGAGGGAGGGGSSGSNGGVLTHIQWSDDGVNFTTKWAAQGARKLPARALQDAKAAPDAKATKDVAEAKGTKDATEAKADEAACGWEEFAAPTQAYRFWRLLRAQDSGGGSGGGDETGWAVHGLKWYNEYRRSIPTHSSYAFASSGADAKAAFDDAPMSYWSSSGGAPAGAEQGADSSGQWIALDFGQDSEVHVTKVALSQVDFARAVDQAAVQYSDDRETWHTKWVATGLLEGVRPRHAVSTLPPPSAQHIIASAQQYMPQHTFAALGMLLQSGQRGDAQAKEPEKESMLQAATKQAKEKAAGGKDGKGKDGKGAVVEAEPVVEVNEGSKVWLEVILALLAARKDLCHELVRYRQELYTGVCNGIRGELLVSDGNYTTEAGAALRLEGPLANRTLRLQGPFKHQPHAQGLYVLQAKAHAGAPVYMRVPAAREEP